MTLADNYFRKTKTAEHALNLMKSGARVFIGSSCGEPQHLLKALFKASDRFTGIEIVRLLALESTPLSFIANKTQDLNLNIRSFYLGSTKYKALEENQRFITPINLSAVPRLFKSRLLPIHMALIQVSPPDNFGYMSLGISVDVTLAAAESADIVIAQVNSKMPRVMGHCFIHVNDVDVFVEYDEDLLTINEPSDNQLADMIGSYANRLIEDGSTIQMCLGTTMQSNMLTLGNKNDLGIHSQYLTNNIMRLVSMGVVTNRYKGFNNGKIVAGSAVGSKYLYEFIDNNPAIEFHPSDYVNDSTIIARHRRMVTINAALAVDLTGQIAADALPVNNYSGVTGLLDFTRGAAMSNGGKSIITLNSTSDDGKQSRIVPLLSDMAVVVPRGDANWVVTEYGAVNLFGKSIQERVLAMITIAHPNFREELFFQAKKLGFLGPERKLKEAISGIYPINLEESVLIDDDEVIIRPAKPVDERRLQEHFYNLDQQDVYLRFFQNKQSFTRDDVEVMSQIDYIKNLVMLAITGERGFGKIIGVGCYVLDPHRNMAEIAFSVIKEYQRKGIGKILLRKIVKAARQNGIAGLFAYTYSENIGAISLIKSLPYKVQKKYDYGLVLECRFDDSTDS